MLYRPTIARTVIYGVSRRGLITSVRLRAPLTAAPVTERRAPGLQPPDSTHFKDSPTPIHEHQSNKILGDWVLFHPVYTKEENEAVEVLHRPPTSISDRVADLFTKVTRWGFDFVSKYEHKEIPPNHKMSLAELRAGGYTMSERQWLARILFLESIAGVPGMVAAACRHLRSLRLMKRDAGWIHTLLQEAENERMHLMTFMTLKKPSRFFRASVLAAQGVYYNAFFLAYLISPRTAHRFVGYLEEEAVFTYSRIIKEIEDGHLPEWENLPAPAIAIEYWRLPADAKLLDVMYAVRSDESTHRFVNHSLASLETGDTNPFALGEPGMKLKGTKIGFERDESARYVRQKGEQTQHVMEEKQKKEK
ncbi:alternative oxidase [Cantharellus anzutake]|uniref:alternative oxidase n=1 Tax=Cantharellus anzutake TaxID=1750568 RepID=UPI0019040653|nr:alternative oxidase [Cantharellus anzutake]KAF8333536.1 alternative oxidase [Cantharellus anzutake]